VANRFDKFSERARRVLTYSQEEAQRLQHNYIGTEHLLLGLVREENGVAFQVLTNLGAKPDVVRSAVEFIIPPGDAMVSGGVGLTERGRKAIEIAVDESRAMGDDFIGTEHLLGGIIGEGEGIAFGVLESLGVTLSRVRTEVRRLRQLPSLTPEMDVGKRPANNPTFRSQAAVFLRGAITAIEQVDQAGLSHHLLQTVILPRLAIMLADLELDTAKPQEVIEARARLRDGVSTLISLRDAFNKQGMRDVALALSSAAGAVSTALAGGPPPPGAQP
jgi:hypothetical protein